jgi:MFS family permease
MFVAASRFLPESSDPEGRRFDIPGLVLGAVAVMGVTFAVIEGENVGYGRWWVPLLFAVAAVAAAAFVWVEHRSPDPVLRLEFFRSRAFSGATTVAFATSFGLFAVFFFSALYLQIIVHFSGWKIALEFAAMSVAMVVAGRVAGIWTGARGPREPMTIGCLVGGAGMVWVDGLFKPSVSSFWLAVALAVVGFGLGLALVAVTSAVLAVVPSQRSGMAASTVNTSREFGGVLAVAILGSVLNAQLVGDLGRKLSALGVSDAFRSLVIDAVTHGGLPANAAGAAAASPVAAANIGVVAKVLQDAEDAFGNGLHTALIVTALVLFAATVPAALTGRATAAR